VYYTLTTGIFSSSNSNTRTLEFGFTRIVITGNNTTVCDTSIGTGLTVVAPNSGEDGGIELTYSGGVGTRTITGASVATAIEGTNLLNYVVRLGTDIVTFTGNCAYRNIKFEEGTSFTGTLTNDAIFIYGRFTLSTGMTLTAGLNTWTFKATSSTFYIHISYQTINNPITFNGIGGGWRFGDTLTMGSTQTLTLINGTVQLKSNSPNVVGALATSGTNQKYLYTDYFLDQAGLIQVSGIVNVNNLEIFGISASGGAVFNAFTTNGNVDSGRNSGWYFLKSVNFLPFF